MKAAKDYVLNPYYFMSSTKIIPSKRNENSQLQNLLALDPELIFWYFKSVT